MRNMFETAQKYTAVSYTHLARSCSGCLMKTVRWSELYHLSLIHILIIDEFSMVDQWLFYHVLKASKQISQIILIGDEDQLPSVGPGCVLKDLIHSNQFSLVRLNKIFRQSEGSDVVTLAHEVREGRCEVLDHASDIAFFPCDHYDMKDQILKVVQNAFMKGYADVYKRQVTSTLWWGLWIDCR